MKKAITTTALSVSTLLALASSVFAQTPVNIAVCPTTGIGSAICSTLGQDATALQRLIQFLITTIFVVAILIAIFFIILGGVKWILSGGDKAAVEAARNTIVAAVIGLVIVFIM